MTVVIHIGRRVPRSWFRRKANTVKGLITFQENIWLMIKQSMNLAKRKAQASGNIIFLMTSDMEIEDINYEINWLKIIIRGTYEQEEEEYNDSLKLYTPFANLLKKDIEKDERFAKQFKSKILPIGKVEDAYKAGYGAVGDNNISNKLLEMGILTHVEWLKDFDSRKEDLPKI